MSNSSPADLAVAFRSLTRRLREAVGPTTPLVAVGEAEAAVSNELNAAAKLLGCANSADAVAQMIEGRQLQDWSDPDLAMLQAIAQQAARAVRNLEDQGQSD